MRLLSIDLSTVGTGWAFFKNEKLENSDTIKATGGIEEKLKIMYKGLDLLFQRWNPYMVVSEAPVFVKYQKRHKQCFLPGIEPKPKYNGNPDVFIKLCKLHGVLLSFCFSREIELYEMQNLKWKSHFFDGNLTEVTKEQIFTFCQKIFNSDVQTFDEADAICIGKAFIAEEKFRNLKKGA